MTPGKSEHQIRLEVIDAALRKAGWLADTSTLTYENGARPRAGVRQAIAEWPCTDNPDGKPWSADYVLFDGLDAVAVVEAKSMLKGTVSPMQQTLRYAGSLAHLDGRKYGDYKVPFVYATNGREIRFQDIRTTNSLSRPIPEYHTPDALHTLLLHGIYTVQQTKPLKAAQDKSIQYGAADEKGVLAEPPPDSWELWAHQKRAIHTIETNLLRNHRRQLLVMATGTGKTKTVVYLMYRLLKAKLFRRVLFLVDRNLLATQAYGKFAETRPEGGKTFAEIYEITDPRIREDEISPSVQVHICTVQSLCKKLMDGDGNYLNAIDPFFFDCVIVDEAHRGYVLDSPGESPDGTFKSERDYQAKYRKALDYFDAVRIGLTATPAVHTVNIFGKPSFTYSYTDAVKDGILVDYEAVAIKTYLSMTGITLNKGDYVKMLTSDTGEVIGEFLEDELDYDLTQFNKSVITREFNRAVVAEVVKHLKPFEKVIVFARRDTHADMLVELFREHYPEYGDQYVQKITGAADRPEQLTRLFELDKNPAIAVTVDLLTTGVDIPWVQHLLFVRPVNSRILFEQMLGRGTRRPDGKEKFTVYDPIGLLQFMSQHTDMQATPTPTVSLTFEDLLEDYIDQPDMRAANAKSLLIKLNRLENTITDAARAELEQMLPEHNLKTFIDTLRTVLADEKTADLKKLLATGIPNFLDNCPRRGGKTPIYEGADEVVTVDTNPLHDATGKPLRPDDYIQAFERFVTERSNEYEAMQILLKKPSSFKYDDLKELSQALAAHPLNFTERKLRHAYKDSLADVIAFVRRAGLGVPLEPPAYRAERAMEKLRQKHKFSKEQLQWLDLIYQHLTQNYFIEQTDFNEVPFDTQGGFSKANAVFGGSLPDIVQEINEYLYDKGA